MKYRFKILCIILIALGSVTLPFLFYPREENKIQKAAASSSTQHYLYVLPEGGKMYVYDMDNNHSLIKTIQLPSKISFIRGMGADPLTHSLYLAYGNDTTGGHLFKMDLLTDQEIYDQTLPVGSDSFDIIPDGKTIYMPDGDTQSNGIWRVIDATTGKVTSSIDTGGHNPHNTIVSLDGKHVYMGPRISNYLVLADISTNKIIKQIGPVQSGIRPFTINNAETLAYIETSDFLGFDVADIITGKILYKVSIPGKSTTGGFAPTHGISLSPDEKEIYISDWPNSKVHIFDVTAVPQAAPKLVLDLPVHNMVGNDVPCVGTNCLKEGWVLHSLDGRFVYVGDAGDVIDTATRKSIAFIDPLANTRKFIEIDWQNGLPVATSTRYGKGRVNSSAILTPAPTISLSNQADKHYLYTFVQNIVTVSDIDNNNAFIKTITLPTTVHSVRGLSTDVPVHMMYISYGSNSSNGSLLKYDLLTDQVIYTKTYATGIDSFALTADGKKIYMPDGDFASGSMWRVIDTTTGNIINSIAGGACPHNTVTGPQGKYIYLAGRCSPYVYVVDPNTDKVVRQIGPFKNNGVRPFTVNGSETLVYVTDNNFIGFETGDITTGKVLYSSPATGYTCNCQSFDAPSHGISLSPDEKEVYIPDRFNGKIHVFDVSGLPSQTPKLLTSIPLTHTITGNAPAPCTLDCNREGWVMHSKDGKHVFVGDSGDVIDTTLHKVSGFIGSLQNSRIYSEIDFLNNSPVFTTNRYGLGYGGQNASGGKMQFALTNILLHGVGNGGDSLNSLATGTLQPIHSTREVTFTLADANNLPAFVQKGTLTFNTVTKSYQGTIDISSVPQGKYIIRLTVPGYLAKQAPGFIVDTGATQSVNSLSLVAGDITKDNQLDVLDYNALISCFASKQQTNGCLYRPDTSYQGADITDDGIVNGSDYNLLLRELSVQK